MRSLRQTPHHLALQSLTNGLKGKITFLQRKQIFLIRKERNSSFSDQFLRPNSFEKTGIFLESSRLFPNYLFPNS